MVEEFRSVSQRKVGEGFIGDMPYTDYEYYFTEEQIDWLRTALTGAHQAGIDEAVDICWRYCGTDASDNLEDAIKQERERVKALQDNK